MCTPSLESHPGATLSSACQPFSLKAGQDMQAVQESVVIRSKFRGLSWDKKHQSWRVRIYWAGKQRHVGRFDDDVAAAKAYDKAAVFLYGSNAITNFGLEACNVDPTEVSAFIVLAKEQAEQEQLIRSQHRQHYSMHPAAGLHGGITNGYMLPQQAYLPHQQQQKSGTVLSLGRGSWPACTGSPQAVNLAAVSSAPGLSVTQGLAQHQQQMWGAVPAMLHQQTSLPQAMAMGSGYMAAGQDAGAAGGVAQYTNTYMMAAGQQLMQGAGGPAAGSNPGSMLLAPQHQQQYLLQAQHQSQQQQHQQLMMCAAGSPAAAAASLVPVSQCQLGPQMAVGPVGTAASSAPSACPMAPAGGSNDLVLQHAAAASSHGAAAGNSPLASSAGGSTFVQDMLQSLNYAAAGPGMSAAGQQQQCLVLPQAANWMAEASSKAAVTSWAMPAHPAAGTSRLNGLTVAAGVLDSSPSFSTASSTSAATNNGFALPVMRVASSTACA